MEFDDDDASDPNFAVAAGDNVNDCSSEESVKDKNASWVSLLDGVVRTNDDYGFGNIVVLQDPDATALAMSEAVVLQALKFFASHSVVRTGGFTKLDPPISFHCLPWKLAVLFTCCNRDGYTGCRGGRYIQHTRCKNVSVLDLSRTLSAATLHRCRKSFSP
jgi:hypothetical protein